MSFDQPGPPRQAALRRWGRPLFDALAKPSIVSKILEEPYFDADQVTDEVIATFLSHFEDAWPPRRLSCRRDEPSYSWPT